MIRLKKLVVIAVLGAVLMPSMARANEGFFNPSGIGAYTEADYYAVWAFHAKREIGMVFTATSGFAMKSTLLQSNSQANNIAQGGRFNFTLSPTRKVSAQFSYTGLVHWRYKKYFNRSQNDLYVPIRHFISQLNFFDWGNLHTVNVDYDEHFDSWALLMQFHLTPRDVDYFAFSCVGGGRVIRDHNTTYYLGQKANNTNRLHFIDENLLMGAELGGSLQYRATKRFQWNIPIKFGMYANVVKHNQFGTRANGNIVFTRLERSRQYPSYTIDINPTIIYWLGPAYFRLGYQYLGIFNLAYSNIQTSFNRISWHGDLQSQGGLIGLGVHW